MVTAASVIRARSSSKLTRRGGTKTLYLTYPHREKFKFVKSGDRGGKAIVPPSLICMRLHDDWQDFWAALHERNAIWHLE
jgi:hypothetical protein